MDNQEQQKNPVGAPRKYSAEMFIEAAQKVIARALEDESYVPTVMKVGIEVGASEDTVWTYVKESKELSEACEKIASLQKDKLINNGLTEKWNSPFAKFLLSANHGMKETTAVEGKQEFTIKTD